MSSVVIVTENTTADLVEHLDDLISDLGHTVTLMTDTSVTVSNLSAHDIIVNYAIQNAASAANLASWYNDYMSVDGIAILWLADYHGHPDLTDDNFITGKDYVQCLVGVNPVTYRNRYATGVDAVGYGAVFPLTQFEGNQVSMEEEAHENVLGQGFLQPNFQGSFTGESFVWGSNVISGGDVAAVPPGAAQVAGTPLVRLRRSVWGSNREVAAGVYEIGDSRVGQVSGTFATRGAYCGLEFSRVSRNAAQLLQALVRWCNGDYASATTYSTTAKSSSFRYPSFALDSINGTTYGTSTISWTEVTPAATSVIVQASLDGESFSTIASSGDPIPGLTPADPLAGLRLTIRVELKTTDGVSTPQFKDLEVVMNAQQEALTPTPADYFQEGHLTWTSGVNNGLSTEVKSYDDALQAVTLFLKMRSTVSVGDTFTILPGCDKKRATCNTKFGNVLNFQGEPDVPGEDQTLQAPDQPE